MKKAKIMLMAIAIFAVAGGVLAFKTRATNKNLVCYTTQDPGTNGFCAFGTSMYITNGIFDFDAFYSTEQVPATVVDPDAFCTTIHCDYGGQPFRIDQ